VVLHRIVDGMKKEARIQAEKKAATAAAAFRNYNGNSEAEVLSLNAAYKSAVAELVALEIAHPTYRETARRNRRIALSSRGLDI
jgi:hypothetical protein